jgi:hypothetical protein
MQGVVVNFKPSFTPGERAPGTHWVGGRVEPRASPNVMDIIIIIIIYLTAIGF